VEQLGNARQVRNQKKTHNRRRQRRQADINAFGKSVPAGRNYPSSKEKLRVWLNWLAA
jgi:ribosomal protein L44E